MRMNKRDTAVLRNERDPRKKVHLLLSSANDLLRSDLKTCGEYCAHSISEARASKLKDLLAISLTMTAKCFLFKGDRKKSVEQYKQALSIYEKMGDIDAALEIQNAIISTKLSTGNERELIEQLHELLHARTSALRPNQNNVASSSVASNYLPRTWDNRVLGQEPSQAEIEATQRYHLAAIFDSLGRAYIIIREHHKAASFLEEGLAIYNSVTPPRSGPGAQAYLACVGNAMSNLGYAHALLGNSVAALEYCQKGMKIARQLQDKRGIAINQRNLAHLYLNIGQVSLGKSFAMKSLQTSLELGSWESACRALVMVTRYERLHGSLARAATLSQKALKILKDKEKGSQFYYFTLQLLLVEHAKKPSVAVYGKLLELHKITREKGLQLQHEISQEIARVAEELKLLPDAVKWFRRVHEYEIQRLNTEQRSVLLSLQTEQELERLAQERELDKLKMDKLELELAAKVNETKLLALQLAKKGSFLATLTDQIASLKSSYQNYSSETIEAVVQLIESIRHRDKDYEQLEERAEALHHDFVVSLSERYPDLTVAEKRICILMRLGLNAQEVANVQFTSVRTIETHSLSIRKKLRIPKSTRLSKFLEDL